MFGLMFSPAELVLHYHCLTTSCVDFHEDTGIGAAVFPPETKYRSEAPVVEFLQGPQMTSICRPRLAPVV